jgi:uncharacterized coiled-coil DUF342 family protein
MTAYLKLCVGVIFSAALVTQGATVKSTPVEKVVTLLKNLQDKLTAEGATEAAQYDKFACFCKEQADEKQYAMEKSDKKLKYLKAEIAELRTAKSNLEQGIAGLTEHIDQLENDMDTKSQTRERQHGKYLERAKDMNEAISGCERAVDALKNSKEEMRGAKLDLTQVTSDLVDVVKRQPFLSEDQGAVALLSKIDQKGAPKFQYQSNDIIATLEDLQATFVQMKKRLDFDEFAVKQTFDQNMLGMSNEKKFATKERTEKDSIAEAKSEAIGETQTQIDGETDAYEADKQFRARLATECEERAKVYDQRSSVRANELTTLDKATKTLQSGAVKTYNKAAKGLSELQQSAVGRLRNAAGKSSPVTLVQIKKVQHQVSRAAELLDVRNFLNDAADRTDSPALSAVAVRVSLVERSGATEDHFVKVRGLIKDLLQKLEDDAHNEQTQKGACDGGIEKAVKDRDEGKGRIEISAAKLTVLNSNREGLVEENEMLTEQIAELKKAILEAVELFKEQEADLDEKLGMCDEGTDSVKLAINLLETFYGGAEFLQAQARPISGSDRDGNRVQDLAPETAQGTYHGAESESLGIIGILDVILNDFHESLEQAEADKKEAIEYIDLFKKETEIDITAKTKKRDETNAASITGMDSQITGQEEEHKDATELLDSALKALEGWHSMCVKGEETYEERKASREREIAALKEALDILEAWKS